MRVRLGGTRRTHTRPAPAVLRLPAAYDVLDVPAAAGHRVLLQLERLGTPLGPVLAVLPAGPGHEHEPGGGRLRFFVEAGTTASFLADLKELGWEPTDTDIRTIGMVLASETPLPPAGSPRWVRPPETERPLTLPPARLLLGALAYACRRTAHEGRPVSRPPLGTS
ncbi:hypothetical protein [Catenulispora subtropica]|uniref:Uncharacterized protein n=1 Tax=Catenulispora subtropica TaxID=450798 RepID=A0ABP5DCD4_9ACTN